MEHALFFCNHTRAVWFRSYLGFQVHEDQITSVQSWWNNLVGRGDVRENHILEKGSNNLLEHLRSKE